eukprot:TRINITY_DN329_c0_g1_i1.p1 TRINITY_DN329_c0_g1~~TRINITY_DN329_c0_g1_i1.p1  ORF type:complete len:298 (+),score=92.67 TRINITY_DN329_c0_g1_i1:74-967(+)
MGNCSPKSSPPASETPARCTRAGTAASKDSPRGGPRGESLSTVIEYACEGSCQAAKRVFLSLSQRTKVFAADVLLLWDDEKAEKKAAAHVKAEITQRLVARTAQDPCGFVIDVAAQMKKCAVTEAKSAMMRHLVITVHMTVKKPSLSGPSWELPASPEDESPQEILARRAELYCEFGKAFAKLAETDAKLMRAKIAKERTLVCRMAYTPCDVKLEEFGSDIDLLMDDVKRSAIQGLAKIKCAESFFDGVESIVECACDSKGERLVLTTWMYMSGAEEAEPAGEAAPAPAAEACGALE